MINLICIYYPQQLLPALSAVSFYQTVENCIFKNLVLFVFLPKSMKNDTKQERKAFFKQALVAFPNIELIFSDEVECLDKLHYVFRVKQKAHLLKKYFGENKLSKIFYSHDLSSDFTAQAFMQAFPKAASICFGDGLGIFFDRDYFSKFFFPVNLKPKSWNSLLSTLKNICSLMKRTWSLSGLRNIYQAEILIASIPITPNYQFYADKKLYEIEKNIVMDVLEKLNICFKLNVVDDAEKSYRQKYLFLAGSFFESKLMSLKSELNLYCDVIRKHVPLNGTVLIKCHPSASSEKIERLIELLKDDYHFLKVENSELPIELLPELLKNTHVIAFSF